MEGTWALGSSRVSNGPGRPEGHHRQPVGRLHHDAGAIRQLPLHIVQQQGAAVFGQPVRAGAPLPRQSRVGRSRCPRAGRGVQVGAAHDGALVFKTLHPFPLVRELPATWSIQVVITFDGGRGSSGRVLP